MTEIRRIEKIEVKLTPAQKLQVKEDAKRMKQSVSDYVRSIVLHERQTEAEENESFLKPSTANAEPSPPNINPPETSEAEKFKRAADLRAKKR